MKVSAIKQLADQHELQALQTMVEQIENEQPTAHEIPGDDEGEQLTHLLGAIWIKEQMQANNTDLKTELRNFSARVRGSIS